MSSRVEVAVWLRHKTVPCFCFSEADRLHLERSLPELRVTVCADRAAFVEALPVAQIAIVWVFRQEWLSLAPGLRLLATPAAGRDYFEVVLPAHVAAYYGSFQGELMAETVVGMMLGSARGVLQATRLQHSDPWPRSCLAHSMRSLRGSHVVILGFGNIGEWIARLAKPFGTRISGIKRSTVEPPPYFQAEDRVLGAGALDDVLPTADHLVVCLPRSPETDRILNARRLALLPQHAVVYNVGRGNAVDEGALAAALQSGKIGGACLDVYACEPLAADSPLRQCENALLMPHASAFSPNYMSLFIDEFAAFYRRASDRTLGSCRDP